MNAKSTILMVASFFLALFVNASGDLGVLDLQNNPAGVMDPGVQMMTADLIPVEGVYNSEGRLVHRTWYDTNDVFHTSFMTEVYITVPNKLPGFETMDSAMNADVSIKLSHHGVPYAQCWLTPLPVVYRSAVVFGVDIEARWDGVKPRVGVCDVDMTAHGIQSGVPSLAHGVMINTYVADKFHEEFMILEGWCE